MAKRRTNVIREPWVFHCASWCWLNDHPLAIVEDARLPQRYRMLLSTVDVIFADVAQPDQARIVAVNAHYFLKNNGHTLISIKANCIDSTMPPAQVFAREVETLRKDNFKPIEQVTLEPYERDHAMVAGKFSPSGLGTVRSLTHFPSPIPPRTIMPAPFSLLKCMVDRFNPCVCSCTNHPCCAYVACRPSDLLRGGDTSPVPPVPQIRDCCAPRLQQTAPHRHRLCCSDVKFEVPDARTEGSATCDLLKLPLTLGPRRIRHALHPILKRFTIPITSPRLKGTLKSFRYTT